MALQRSGDKYQKVFIYIFIWGKDLSLSSVPVTQEASNGHNGAHNEGWPTQEPEASFYWLQPIGLYSTLSKLKFLETHSEILKKKKSQDKFQKSINNDKLIITSPMKTSTSYSIIDLVGY